MLAWSMCSVYTCHHHWLLVLYIPQIIENFPVLHMLHVPHTQDMLHIQNMLRIIHMHYQQATNGHTSTLIT